jgi:hypothetical protein
MRSARPPMRERARPARAGRLHDIVKLFTKYADPAAVAVGRPDRQPSHRSTG